GRACAATGPTAAGARAAPWNDKACTDTEAGSQREDGGKERCSWDSKHLYTREMVEDEEARSQRSLDRHWGVFRENSLNRYREGQTFGILRLYLAPFVARCRPGRQT